MTISLAPRTVNSIADPRLLQLRKALVGNEIVAITYANLAGARWPHGHRHDRDVHEVDMGVELKTRLGSTLRVAWAIPGSDEGLAVDMYEREPSSMDSTVELLDVSDRMELQRFIARPISEIALAFYSYDGESEDRPWSLSLRFEDGGVVALALGEVSDNKLSYMPDNLLVILDEKTAAEYRVAESRSSALGETV